MSVFLIAAALLVVVATATILWPLIRRVAAHDVANESPALKVLREQRADLEAEHAAGKIDAANYAQTRSEIERRALEESTAPEAVSRTGPRLAWAIAIGIALPTSAIGVYLMLGNPTGLDPVAAVTHAENEVTPAQIDAMVSRVAARVKANPDDLQALQMLGRSYMVLNRFSEAADAFKQLAAKQPDNAQAFADWADASAAAQGRKLSGEPEKLINKALSIDPQNIKALALSGSIAFDRRDFKQAVTQWEKIAALVPGDSEFGQSVHAMIAEARTRGGMPAASPAANPEQAAPAPLALKGTITVAAALKSQIAADDVLFVFARPAAGGPPVAGMRFKASELPLEFDFSKAQMMMGRVGPQDKVIIGARVSKKGNPIAAPGDLQGLSQPIVGNSDKALHIEISEQVK